MSQANDFDCQEILNLEKGIRFVGVCSKEGLLLDYAYGEQINPLFSVDDLKQSIQNTITRNKIRSKEAEKMGDPVYSVTAYQNVKRATIVLDDKLLLLVSFESKKDEYQTMQKILHYIKNTVSYRQNKNKNLQYEAV